MTGSSSEWNSKVRESIFQAEAAPMCKNLVWAACQEALPVRSLLLEKGIVENDSCPCCGMEKETTTHALLQCEEVKCFWFGSPLGLRVDSIHNLTTVKQWIEENLDLLDEKAMGMLCVIMWAVWNKRNLWVLKRKKLDFPEVMAMAVSMFFPDKWVPPSHPQIKANFSTCIRDEVGTALGVVYRDSRGAALASATNVVEKECFDMKLDMKLGEALCFRWALAKAEELCFCDVVFETDCIELYHEWNQLKEGKGNGDDRCFLNSLLEDSREMIERKKWGLTLVGSGGNTVARRIALEAFVQGEAVWIEEVVDEASLYLLADCAAISTFPANQ